MLKSNMCPILLSPNILPQGRVSRPPKHIRLLPDPLEIKVFGQLLSHLYKHLKVGYRLYDPDVVNNVP